MTAAQILNKLKAASGELADLAIVAQHARSLAEWSDATDAMATKMETLGDLLDQADSADLGFVNNYRRTTPLVDLLERARELQGDKLAGVRLRVHGGVVGHNCSK